MPGCEDRSLASMGIYIFEAEYLYQLLEEDILNQDSKHDFGMDLIPRIVEEGLAFAHPFSMSCVGAREGQKPYWRDVGTLDSFWEANMDLASVLPELDIYDQNWPIWTSQTLTPPAKFVQDRNGQHGMTINSMFSGGTIVSGSFVLNSVLFTNV
ncbi:sugar phosphate nucleotidyltransferase, partial [Aeromonas allosaccharophila]